jgi:hypothetical protein
MEAVLLKVVLFSSVVVVLTLVTRKLSAGLGGLLAAFPTGQAFSLFFFGLERDVNFAAQSALYNLCGIFAGATIVLVYVRMSRVWHSPFVTAIFSVFAFAVAALLLTLLPVNPVLAVAVPLVGVAILAVFIAQNQYAGTGMQSAPRSSTANMVLTAIFSSFILVTIIEIGSKTSPTLAGLLSAFPATLFPAMFVAHAKMGPQTLYRFARAVPTGQVAMIAFGITVSMAFPVHGIVTGTLIAYGVALAVVLILEGTAYLMRVLLRKIDRTRTSSRKQRISVIPFRFDNP